MCQLGLVLSATAPLARVRGDPNLLYQDPGPLTVCFAAVIGRVRSRITRLLWSTKVEGSVIKALGKRRESGVAKAARAIVSKSRGFFTMSRTVYRTVRISSLPIELSSVDQA